MRKTMKKPAALALSTLFAISLAACGGASGDKSSSDTKSAVGNIEVSTLMAGNNEVLVCYPTPNAEDNGDICYATTAPVFVVFGDGTYDEESASEYAITSGLADIASENGSSICFVNPQQDGAWSGFDSKAYQNVVDLISDSSSDEHTNGVTKSVDYMTQAESQAITGSSARIYVYGIDSGADYVAENVMKPVKTSITFPDGFTLETDSTATAITVSGLSDASKVEDNDIPVVSIGNSDDVNKVLKEKCGSVTVEDKADYVSEYADVVGNWRRQVGILVPVYNWEKNGITESIETYTVNTSADNVTFAGQATHDIGYVAYYDENLDVENGNVPLVLCFHGGGGTALHEAQWTSWPIIGKENGFMTVSVDLHFPNCTATEIVDLINHLEEEYSIDSSRIYASGFSMGGCKSWDLFEQYPSVFAGLAPMDASFEPTHDSFDNPVANPNSDVLVPLFYVGGETSPLAELPMQSETLVNRLAYVFGVNALNKQYNVSFADMASWENPVWGINGDMSYTVTDKETFKDSVLTVNLFASADGKYYTAFANSSNQSHEIYPRNSKAAWDFLSQFSRGADGNIVINDVTYDYPSDDGIVVDNSYNK
ncbi:MAG: hypothetical protein E7242_00585 [Lachnospiraceae bacterium]|nr:hypothetical protein [Lachnospiraceae bacterium]